MPLKLEKAIFECLKGQRERKLTARQIAEWIFETYPEECQQKQARSKASVKPLDNTSALLQQIGSEVGARRVNLQKKYPKIKITEGRPRKYYYTEQSDEAEIAQAEEKSAHIMESEDRLISKEHDLYPLLSEYLSSELSLYSKRIDEKRSHNNYGPNGNKWLYPDLVALEDLSSEWDREVKDCVHQYAGKRTRLWSFEVKMLINRSNVREAFFQTVSNSSWANFAYLVSGDIEGSDTLQELRMLSGLQGIGFIRFSAENPSESQIILPARERTEVDWNVVNRLATENRDFMDYIRLVRQFYQTGDLRSHDWDASVGIRRVVGV